MDRVIKSSFRWYKLNPDHSVTPCDIDEKLEFDTDRHVGDTTINGIRVSTVFLQLDHSFFPGGPPVLFETMIFGGEHDQYQNRYHTWDEAEKAHNAIVRAVTEGVHPETYLNFI